MVFLYLYKLLKKCTPTLVIECSSLVVVTAVPCYPVIARPGLVHHRVALPRQTWRWGQVRFSTTSCVGNTPEAEQSLIALEVTVSGTLPSTLLRTSKMRKRRAGGHMLDQTSYQMSDQMFNLIIGSDVRSDIRSNIKWYQIWYDLILDVISDLIFDVSDLIESDIG